VVVTDPPVIVTDPPVIVTDPPVIVTDPPVVNEDGTINADTTLGTADAADVSDTNNIGTSDTQSGVTF
jgi:hypothetical protein